LLVMQSGKTSVFKYPIRYLSLLFGLLYPWLVQMTLTTSRSAMPGDSSLYQNGYLLHLPALVLLIATGSIVIYRLNRKLQKKAHLRRILQVLTLLAVLYLVPSEYNHLSVYAGVTGGSLQTPMAIEKLIALNLRLPDSLLLGLVSVAALIWATLKHYRFLRRFSIGMLLLVLIKIFVFDIGGLSADARVVVMIVVGVVLIAFSIAYPKLSSTKLSTNKNTNGFTNKNTNEE
jgi:uncharacterized membrane protein